MTAPDFVVVGQAVQDVVPGGGWRLGGTVTFAAVQAHRLGLSVGIVTSAGADLDVQTELPFAQVVQRRSAMTSRFENVYVGDQRHQSVRSRADAPLRADVPEDWRSAPIVLLGPVLDGLASDFASVFASAALVGVSVQGWLRRIDDAGHVVHTGWDREPFWRGADVLFVSDEDLSGSEGGEVMLERWTHEVPIVAMTLSWKGARIYSAGAWRRMDAFPEVEVDPSGAGDTFATALLVRLRETGDVLEAARFGAAAASLSVSGVGVDAIPARAEIEARLREHPGVALR